MDISSLSIVVSVLGWPICGYLGYRFALNSKKIDLKRSAYENVRSNVDLNWKEFKEFYKTAYRQKNMNVRFNNKPIRTVGDYYNNLFTRLKFEIEQELLSHNDLIGGSERKRIIKIVVKIEGIASEVKDVIPDSESFPSELETRFQKLMSKIRRIA